MPWLIDLKNWRLKSVKSVCVWSLLVLHVWFVLSNSEKIKRCVISLLFSRHGFSAAGSRSNINRVVNRLPVNQITDYVTRDRFQLTVTDTRKSNCDLRHLAVGRDTSVDRKQIILKSVHRSRWLMSIKVFTAPNLQWALSTDRRTQL